MTLARTVPAVHPVEPQDRARADTYALIARLFYAAPDDALLESISGSGNPDAAVTRAALPTAWDALRRAAREVSAEEVSVEYDATFIGVGKPEVMLFGSYYLAGFLHEKPLVRVRSDLAAFGFARRAGVAEPEDHIAGLADVMRQLILDETRTPSERDEAQRRFFFRHIEPWYGSLCDAIEAASGARFYRSVARTARAFFEVEGEAFRIA